MAFTAVLILFGGFMKENKFLKMLSKIANDSFLSNLCIFGGITLASIGHIMIAYGSYYRGLHYGVEIRDEYYYQKEIENYEQSRKLN